MSTRSLFTISSFVYLFVSQTVNKCVEGGLVVFSNVVLSELNDCIFDMDMLRMRWYCWQVDVPFISLNAAHSISFIVVVVNPKCVLISSFFK